MKCDERRAPAVLKGGAKPLSDAFFVLGRRATEWMHGLCGPGPQQVVVRGGARLGCQVQRAYSVHGRHGIWACGFLRSSHARLLLRLLMLLVLRLLLLLLVQFRLLHPGHPRPPAPLQLLLPGHPRPWMLLLLLLLRPPFVLLLLLLLVVLLRRLMLLLLLRSRLRQLLRRRQLIAVGPVPHLLRSGRTSATCRTSALLRSGRVLVRTHVLAARVPAAPAPAELSTRIFGHGVDEKMETLEKCSACTHLVKCHVALHSRHWLDQVPPTVFELLVYTDGMLLRTTDYLIDLRTKDTVKARRSYPNRMRC